MDRLRDSTQVDSQEVTPLLSSTVEDNDAAEAPVTPRSRTSWPWTRIVALCAGVILLADVGVYLFVAPRIRLFESVLCTKYWSERDPTVIGSDGSVPELLCKVDTVQDHIAGILGWQAFFDAIPAILLPVPYGILADKYGRKWIVTSAIMGVVLSWVLILVFAGATSLPLQYVWLSSLFQVVGGGGTVASTLIFTIAADVCPVEKRSTAFFYMFTCQLAAECLIPPLTAILMAKNTYIPLTAAIIMLALAGLLTIVLPETLPISKLNEDEIPAHPIENSTWMIWLRKVQGSFAFAARAGVVAVLFTFFVHTLASQSGALLLQYVSKRYEWSLSKSGLLQSLKAAVNIALFMVILPMVSKTPIFKKNSMLQDLWVARGSLVLLIFGYFILAISGTAGGTIFGIIISTLGTGFPIVLRSLVTSMVDIHSDNQASDVGRLYALVSLVQGIGAMIAGPGMALAFQEGIKLGKTWLGLPFGIGTVLLILISPLVFVLKVPRPK